MPATTLPTPSVYVVSMVVLVGWCTLSAKGLPPADRAYVLMENGPSVEVSASATRPYLAPFACSLAAASNIWSQVQPAAGTVMPAALKASTSYQMP